MSEIVECFARVRRNHPHRALVLVPAAGAALTATDLWSCAVSVRDRIRSAALAPGRPILSLAGNRPESIALVLACCDAGRPLMPLDPSTTPAETLELARRFGASALLLPCGAWPGESSRRQPVAAGLDLMIFDEAGPDAPSCAEAAVLKVTSGTSGLPKATFTTEAELIADASHIVEAMGIHAGDTQIAAIPLSHSYGLGNLVLPLLVQGTALVMRESFHPQQVIADARAHRPRVFPGVPFMFDHFLTTPPDGGWPPSLGLLISAGAPLGLHTLRGFHDRYGMKIHSFYGASETGGIAYDDTDHLPDELTVGRPMPGVTVDLRPEEGAPPDSGRVHVAGAAVARGYVDGGGRGEEFVDEGFLTGDFGRFTARGHLVLTGRASGFINVAGRKVQPDEIERVLCTMPSVAQARVVGIPDPLRGERIVACVVPGEPGLSAVAIRTFCASRLAPYKIPRGIVLLDALPLTSRGKLDRRRLEALAQAHADRNAEGLML